MNESNNNTDSNLSKYDEGKLVVILKQPLDDYGCECFREKINNEVKEGLKIDGKPAAEFAPFERDPSLKLENIELWKSINPDLVGRVIRSHTGQGRVQEGDFIYNFRNDFHE